MSTKEQRVCALEGCEKKFTPYRKTSRYCCREHSVAGGNATRKVSHAPKPCAICGQDFKPAKSHQIYCGRGCAAAGMLAKKRGGATVLPPIPEVMSEADLVQELQARGHRVVLDRPQERRVRLTPKAKTHHRFAVVGDTHMGSRYQQLTYLHKFYDSLEKEGIDTVLHVGDLVHGCHKMHREMAYELFVHGADAQVQYAVENYPKVNGIKTLLISGNHDDSHYNEAGTDVCQRFGELREDVQYLSQRGAYVEMGGVSIYLWHPKGGSSYARSYKLQKSIENFEPSQKPHMLFSGHFHIAAHLPAYRNVEGFLTPCFQSQSPFEKTLGLSPVVGALIIDLWTSKDGIEDLGTRWCIQRQPIPNDY